jgi:hypothetical protein
MADSSSIGAAATTFASFATLGFTISGFTETITHQQANMTYSNQVFVGYPAMAWLGVLFLSFGWAGAFYSVKRIHFGLGITGALLIFASCFVEAATLIYAPSLNVGIALYPLESFGSIKLIEFII